MAMTPKVRWLTNATLNAKCSDGSVCEIQIRSGKYAVVHEIVRYPDGYGDLHLGGELVVEGIKLDEGFELHGNLKIRDAEYSDKKDKVKKPAPTTEKKPPSRNWTKGW
jgi:hypothetical protein